MDSAAGSQLLDLSMRLVMLVLGKISLDDTVSRYLTELSILVSSGLSDRSTLLCCIMVVRSKAGYTLISPALLGRDAQGVYAPLVICAFRLLPSTESFSPPPSSLFMLIYVEPFFNHESI